MEGQLVLLKRLDRSAARDGRISVSMEWRLAFSERCEAPELRIVYFPDRVEGPDTRVDGVVAGVDGFRSLGVEAPCPMAKIGRKALRARGDSTVIGWQCQIVTAEVSNDTIRQVLVYRDAGVSSEPALLGRAGGVYRR